MDIDGDFTNSHCVKNNRVRTGNGDTRKEIV